MVLKNDISFSTHAHTDTYKRMIAHDCGNINVIMQPYMHGKEGAIEQQEKYIRSDMRDMKQDCLMTRNDS